MPAFLRVTVIIPAWNEASTIAACLSAVMAQDYQSDRYEVCVVDNGSLDATLDIVNAFPMVKVLHEPIPGSYAARNRGLKHASGDYVAFTDADCTPAPGWLSAAMRTALANRNAGIVGGPITLYRPKGGSTLAFEYERLFGFKQEQWLALGNCATANWLSPAASLRASGGFETRVRSGADFLLSQRVRASGALVLYAPDMIVRHPARPSVAALAARRRRLSAGGWQRRSAAGRFRYATVGLPMSVVRGFGTILSTPSLRPKLRAGLAGTVVYLALVDIVQMTRMLLGGTPPRS